jgi:Plant ATP synthase F0
MPQLDQFTYLTQFVWLSISFMSYYVLLYNYGLPKISRILKLRARLVSQQNKATDISNQQLDQDEVIAESFKSSVAYLNSSVSAASQWCNEMVTKFNANQLEPLNKAYVRSLAEVSVSQKVKTGSGLRPGTLDTLTTSTYNSKQPASLLNSIYVLHLLKALPQHKGATYGPTLGGQASDRAEGKRATGPKASEPQGAPIADRRSTQGDQGVNEAKNKKAPSTKAARSGEASVQGGLKNAGAIATKNKK